MPEGGMVDEGICEDRKGSGRVCMRKGHRWPWRDDLVLAYGVDHRPIAAICAFERVYKAVKRVADAGWEMDITLQAKALKAMEVIAQRLDEEYDPEIFSQLVGLLSKYIRLMEPMLLPSAPSHKQALTGEAALAWCRDIRRQWVLARHALTMMQERRSGPDKVEFCKKSYVVSLNPSFFVYSSCNHREKAALESRRQSWNWKEAQPPVRITCELGHEDF